jgi:hypothetical protein
MIRVAGRVHNGLGVVDRLRAVKRNDGLLRRQGAGRV